MGGGHISGGMRSSPSRSGFGRSGVGSRGFTHSPSFSRNSSRSAFAHNRFRGNHFRRGRGNRVRFYGFRKNCYGFGCRGYGYPWAYGAYYDPYWLWDSGSSYDEDYERERATANQMNRESLEEQRMRQQEDSEDAYSDDGRYPRSASNAQEAAGAAIMPRTVLVFRDQRQQEVQNYAIIGQTLWAFGSQHTEKIALADLDLAATTKANDDRGVTFRVPASGEGQ